MQDQLKQEREQISMLKDEYMVRTQEMSAAVNAAGTDAEAIKKSQEDQRRKYVCFWYRAL